MSFSFIKPRSKGLLPRACLFALLAVLASGAAWAAPAVDFDALRKVAPDAAAWILLPDTSLNHPVVQGTDNDFYLKHLPNKKPSESGSLFIDYRCPADFTGHNTLIHGHRMKHGAMFGILRNYAFQDYYDQHPVVSISTPDGNYNVQLFAAYTFDQTVESLYLRFKDDATFNEYVSSAKQRSMFRSSVEVNPGDLLVSLLTCEYEHDDGRLVVVGKLIK